MNQHIKSFQTKVSRRQVMIGAAGLSFAIALGDRADAAVLASERTGTAMSPWVSIAPDERSRSCRLQPRWGRDR